MNEDNKVCKYCGNTLLDNETIQCKSCKNYIYEPGISVWERWARMTDKEMIKYITKSLNDNNPDGRVTVHQPINNSIKCLEEILSKDPRCLDSSIENIAIHEDMENIRKLLKGEK